jgi:SagB-type dehydrogenase family enzyme
MFDEHARGTPSERPVLDLKRRYRLSRFAYLHPENGAFVIEVPFSHRRIRLQSPNIFGVLLALAEGLEPEEFLASLSEPIRGRTLAVLQKCFEWELLTPLDASGVAEEDTNHLRTWEFQDLLFHSRSRLGRLDNPLCGGSYRFLGKMDPLPAIRSSRYTATIALAVPDLRALEGSDVPLARVLNQRSSIRRYSSTPMGLEQLGQFLYRTSRCRRVVDNGPRGGEVSHRVAPSGGAMHPLEVYLLAHECRDLPRAVYHYDPLGHRLGQVAAWNDEADGLLKTAGRSAGIEPDVPPILICLAARFARTMWKYSSIAYATILKDVGCLFQTFYLVATAMDLAPSAIGAGDSDAFARLVGSNYYEETTVGEFILGPRA